MRSPQRLDWQEWLAANRDKLGSLWEEKFVTEVLAHVEALDFDFVTAQFPFRDADGKQRYCDFVIQEGEAVRIALEVDGYDKRGTGTGMSREDFVDWQRRQAALVSQGWLLLRFANTDVRDEPQRGREYISLALRRARESLAHQRRLSDSIAKLQKEVADTKSKDTSEILNLTSQITRLKAQLDQAEQTEPLTPAESEHLDQLNAAQEHSKILTKENSTMKTTIWAFTALLAAIIVSFALYATRNTGNAVNPSSSATATNNPTSVVSQSLASTQQVTGLASEKPPRVTTPEPQASPPNYITSINPADEHATKTNQPTAHIKERVALGASCENPVPWRDAGSFTGRWIAVSGPVAEITQSEKSRGAPTWINIGARYPDQNRLTLVIWEDERHLFQSIIPNIGSHVVCALGEVSTYKGIAQIELRSIDQLVTQ